MVVKNVKYACKYWHHFLIRYTIMATKIKKTIVIKQDSQTLNFEIKNVHGTFKKYKTQ